MQRAAPRVSVACTIVPDVTASDGNAPDGKRFTDATSRAVGFSSACRI